MFSRALNCDLDQEDFRKTYVKDANLHKYTFKRIGEPNKISGEAFSPVIHQPSSVQQLDSGGASFLGDQSLDVASVLVDGLETQRPAVVELNVDVNIDPERADWPNQEQTERLIRYSAEEKYVCQICGSSFTPESNLILSHILQDHGDTWRTFDPDLESVSGASDQNTETVASISQAPSAEIVASPSGSAQMLTPTIHLDPKWRSNLIKTFIENAPKKWSEISRIAWRTNEKITDPKTFKRVRQEIVEALIQHCLGIFGDIKRPSESVLQKLAEDLLAKQYPWMFSMEPGNAMDASSLNHGRGLGGWSGEQNIKSFNPFT